MYRNAGKLVFQRSKIYRLNRTLAIVSPNSIQSLGIEMEKFRDENSARLISEYDRTKDEIAGLFDFQQKLQW